MAKRAQPFSLRVDEASLAAYRQAADGAGMKLSEWARLVLDVASGAAQIRHVVFIDVERLESKDAAKKVRTGRW